MTQPHLVRDAIGPDLPLDEVMAAIALGVVSLLLAGVLPAILGELADEHRLSVAGIGLTATFEALAMGLAAACAGIVLPARHLKWIGAGACLLLALADFATLAAQDTGVMAIRAAAGVPEGILLWITIGMIARTGTPERWAGVFFTALTAGQLVIAFLFAQWILPAFGADGGFAALAIVSLAGIAAAIFVPSRYAPLAQEPGDSGAPPLRGWFALFATLVYIGATATVGVYLQPLAHEAGLGADVAWTAVWVSLAAQIAGGATATLIGGHVRYFTVFVISTAIMLATWIAFLLHPPAWAFIAANALGGYVTILVSAFLVPMTIEADPSRRTAVLSGSTQVLASALGPFAASFVVADDNVRGVIGLGVLLLFLGLGLIAALHFTSARNSHTV
ncbi:MAG TPA: hypothetical protein VGB91_04535 [Rhizomicrobium sp.]